jgi:uncharacterized membrane protein YraQ (UPF0718 family)
MEVALLGARITLLRYVVTFLIPVIAGLLANLILSGTAERMREQVRALAGGAHS